MTSFVYDVAFGIEGQFAFEPTDAAHPIHGPDSSQLCEVRRCSRPDDQLLEAVFAATAAGVTSCDPLGAGMIDGNGQRLSSFGLLGIERTSTENSARFGSISRPGRFEHFPQATDRAHDASGLDWQEDC